MESAQLRMERMLPELRDLEQKKTFTKLEISAIVTQRNYYEALIVRPKAPECYLKYIEYEKRLEKLRRLRVGKYGYVRSRTTLSDYSIPLHILNLYSTAVKRFPDSLELWSSYIAYSLTQSSNKLVSRVLSAAIAAHPSHSDFWVMAAQFEADGDETGKGGGNVDGARKLLMRGLRFFKDTTSLPLWVEWIRIELNFIQTIENRRQILGLPTCQSKRAHSINSPEPDNFPVDQALQTTDNLHLLPQDPKTDMTALDRDVGRKELKGHEALLSGALAKVVLQNSFQAVPSLDIFTATLPLLNAFDSPLRPVFINFVYEKISELYPDSPRALVMVATRHLFVYSKDGKTLAASGEELVDLLASTVGQLQRTFTDRLNSPSMSEELLRSLVEIHDILKVDELRKYMSAIIHKTLASITKKKFDTPDLYQLALSHCQNLNKIDDALQLASTATRRFPDCLELWGTRLALLLRDQQEYLVNEKVFLEAIQRFPGSIKLAEKYVQFLKQKHSNQTLGDDELWRINEMQLDDTLKQCPSNQDESNQVDHHPPLSVSEVYQRALVDCPRKMTTVELYKYLSNKSILSLNFLSWLLESNSTQGDMRTLERIHTFITDHPNAKVEDWINHLNFLLTQKLDYDSAYRLLTKAKTVLDRKSSERIEAQWIKINTSISQPNNPSDNITDE